MPLFFWEKKTYGVLVYYQWVRSRLLLVLAITLGVAAGITLLILVACFVCPGCLLHKKRRPGNILRCWLLTRTKPIHRRVWYKNNGKTTYEFDSFCFSFICRYIFVCVHVLLSFRTLLSLKICYHCQLNDNRQLIELVIVNIVYMYAMHEVSIAV